MPRPKKERVMAATKAHPSISKPSSPQSTTPSSSATRDLHLQLPRDGPVNGSREQGG
ncbi:hypothetical protein CGMCC3_g667 [Colletotrichum fructicola]|nr:uncharacterized protein CGMCC3_g667 [Colletotrichum fructicola]KAE9583596.1 hypothetical protein CGMCC3_g667 [Colletotrichum fructicola]